MLENEHNIKILKYNLLGWFKSYLCMQMWLIAAQCIANYIHKLAIGTQMTIVLKYGTEKPAFEMVHQKFFSQNN